MILCAKCWKDIEPYGHCVVTEFGRYDDNDEWKEEYKRNYHAECYNEEGKTHPLT